MKCRLCNSDAVEVHFDFGRQPIVKHLCDGPETPPTYPFKVGFCRECGFQQIVDFIPPETLYQDYLTPSAWKSQPHAERLIETAAAVFGLGRADPILEIGCNDGSFLALLTVLGYSNVLGIEPTKDCADAATKRGLPIIRGFFNSEWASTLYGSAGKPRMIVSRQVLEHVPDLHDFLAGVKQCLHPDGGLLLEVPDHGMAYECLDYAFWEEHVNYFTINTLRLALEMAGLEIVHHETTLFSGKAMVVYAQHARRASPIIVQNRDAAAELNYHVMHRVFRQRAREWLAGQHRVVLVGAGARATNWLNLMGLNGFVSAVVDDQFEKQGKYMPGFAAPIQHADHSTSERLSLLGVNPENEASVIAKHGLKNYASILPPSRHIPQWWSELSAGRGARISEAAE